MSEQKQSIAVKRQPIRRCVGCSEHFPKNQLIRVLRTPEGEIVLDTTGKKSGRGAYLCKKEACFKKARKTGILHRQLNCEIGEEIYEELEQEIRFAEAQNQ